MPLKFLKRILVPTTLTGRAALVGAVTGVLIASVYIMLTSYISSPLGVLAGLAMVLAAAIPGAIIALLNYGLMKLLSKKVISGIIGLLSGLFIMLTILGYPSLFALIIVLATVPFLSALAALVVKITRQDFKNTRFINRLATWSLLILVTGVGLAVTIWYNAEGNDTHLVQGQFTNPSVLDLPDPSAYGAYNVSKLHYGSGTDKRRIAFGEGVHITTQAVDMTPYLPELSTFRLKQRERYWGFDLSNSPVNGTVWYPEGQGPFPLVLIVHGNHDMTKNSDEGYEYLGDLLASRGYITVSVDQNFFNGSFFAGDLTNAANVARGMMLLEHLKVWRDWALDAGSPFYEKIDMSNIALIGHSRGGEAIAIAAALNKETHYPDDANIQLDYGFDIKSLVAIAPVEGSYTPAGRPIALEDVNYLLLHGAHDGDVAVLMGNRQYQRTNFSGKGDYFKSVLYIYQANHGQFNTGWGRRDMRLPLGKMLNVKPLMPAEEQRQIAKVYISAFLDTTIKDEKKYMPLFLNYPAGTPWLPDTLTLSRFQDATFTVISDFEEDINPRSTTVEGGDQQGLHFETWKEGPLHFRETSMVQANNVVYLKWDLAEALDVPRYKITLPQNALRDWSLKADDVLTFSMVDLGHNLDDLTVQLKANDDLEASVMLSDVVTLVPPLEIKFTKLGFIEGIFVKPVEPVLQTYEIPLSHFFGFETEAYDFEALEINFIFEHAATGEVALDDIGFRRRGR